MTRLTDDLELAVDFARLLAEHENRADETRPPEFRGAFAGNILRSAEEAVTGLAFLTGFDASPVLRGHWDLQAEEYIVVSPDAMLFLAHVTPDGDVSMLSEDDVEAAVVEIGGAGNADLARKVRPIVETFLAAGSLDVAARRVPRLRRRTRRRPAR